MKQKFFYKYTNIYMNSLFLKIAYFTAGPAKVNKKNLNTILQWRQKSLNFNKNCKKIVGLNSGMKKLFQSQTLKNEAQWLTKQYFFLVSKLVHIHYMNNGEFIRANSIPGEIIRIQCWFLESSCARFIAIFEIFESQSSTTAGIDGISFTKAEKIVNKYMLNNLKGTKYLISNKQLKFRKDLPKIARVIEENYKKAAKIANLQNLLLKAKLFKTCDLKVLYEKKFEGNKKKRIWILKFKNGGFKYFGISTLRDRVIESIIESAVHPIIEYQADKYSFAYRPNRCLKQITLLLKRYLSNLSTCYYCKQLPLKVFSYTYNSHNNKGGRRKKCFYRYWLQKKSKRVYKNRRFIYIKYKVILVNVIKGFENIKHSIILDNYPLCKKYRRLLRFWLSAFLYGFKNPEDKKVFKRRSKKGIPQEPIISYAIANVILDGLERVFMSGVSVKSKKNYFINLIIIRYIDNILIIGKAPDEVFYLIYNRLKYFLNEKNLSIKEKSQFIHDFMPGKSFTFLGFNYHFINYNSQRFRIDKLANPYFNSYSVVCKQRPIEMRSCLLITIQRNALTKVKQKIRNVVSFSNTNIRVDEIVKRYNNVLTEFVEYFVLSVIPSTQFKFLDFLGYKFFRKFLLKKFSSAPKLYNHISSLYNAKNQFKYINFFFSKNFLRRQFLFNKCFFTGSFYLNIMEKNQYVVNEEK